MSPSSRRFEIVPAIPGHARFIGPHLRQSDADEVWAAVGTDPFSALEESMKLSEVCYTIVLGGAPAAIFGGAPAGDLGVAWLLGTDRIAQHPRAFWAASKRGLEMLFAWRPRLFNFVDARNTTSLRWLERLGATIHEARPYGLDARPFHPFDLVRPACAA